MRSLRGGNSVLPTIQKLRKRAVFFGIYLGRERPSRSQVFTLQLFPGVGDKPEITQHK